MTLAYQSGRPCAGAGRAAARPAAAADFSTVRRSMQSGMGFLAVVPGRSAEPRRTSVPRGVRLVRLGSADLLRTCRLLADRPDRRIHPRSLEIRLEPLHLI